MQNTFNTRFLLKNDLLQQLDMPPPPKGANITLRVQGRRREFVVKTVRVEYRGLVMHSEVLLREIPVDNVDYSLARRRDMLALQRLVVRLEKKEVTDDEVARMLVEASRYAVRLAR